MITITNRQTGDVREIPGPRTVRDILLSLNMVEGAVLVMRDGELLTRDIRVMDGETIQIIPVVSGG